MLFETESIYTYDEYKKSCYGIWVESKKAIFTILLSIFLIFSGIVIALSGSVDFGFYLIIMATLVPFAIFFVSQRRIKKAYYSNKMLKDLAVHFTFYDDYFEVESKTGKSHIEYKNLYKLYEAKDNFYPMTGSNTIYIIEKSKCSKDLILFLRNKALTVN